MYLNKINLKFELNNFESIYEDFAKVIELNPVKDNYFAIGTAKLKLDDYEGAISN